MSTALGGSVPLLLLLVALQGGGLGLALPATRVGGLPVANLTDPLSQLDAVLGISGAGNALRSVLTGDEGHNAALVFLLLADQALGSPDYAAIGKGGWHPTSRLKYRERSEVVFVHPVSQARQDRSRAALVSDAQALLQGEGPADVLVRALAREVGASSANWQPNLQALREALMAELLLPLRALHECDVAGEVQGRRGPDLAVKETVAALARHVVEGDFREWVYMIGKRQLTGLTQDQLQKWIEVGELDHAMPGGSRVKTYEEDGLELMWATKIGGPSHGFDHEPRCLLPLVCNARHRVILIEDEARWPHNAVARCHFRLLHRAADLQPVLHLEPLMTEFAVAKMAPRLEYQAAVLRHAMAKADYMGLPLLLGESFDPDDPPWMPEVKAHPELRESLETLTLMPSNGVFEASDSLTRKHDWVQMDEEVTEPLQRWLYEPKV